MKRLIGLLVVVLAVVPTSEAARKKAPAGVVENGVYRDSKFGFELKLNDNWKANVGKEEENVRLSLVQRNYGIPPRYANAADYTVIPRIAVYADTSSIGAAAMLDSILSPTFKSKQKKDIAKEFEFLSQNGIIPRNKKFVQIAGEAAVIWEGTVKYTKDIASSSSSDQGIRVSGGYGGVIVATRKANTILLFHVMCESDFFDDVVRQSLEVINSLTWGTPEKAAKSEG
jgi:hypothetical protein